MHNTEWKGFPSFEVKCLHNHLKVINQTEVPKQEAPVTLPFCLSANQRGQAAAKCEKTASHWRIFFPNPTRILKRCPWSQLYTQASRSLSLLILNLNQTKWEHIKGWKSMECCEPAICIVSERDISLRNIQCNIWKIQDGECWHVWFVAFVTILLNRPHCCTDSSTLKLYLVVKNIEVRYTKPKEFWSPTWRLTFESWLPAQ